MRGQVVQPCGIVQYLLPIAVFAIVVAFRARRMTQVRPLRLERLWIVPAIYAVLIVVTVATRPPSAIVWIVAVAMLGIGGAVGWQRGRMMTITIDPATHRLGQRGSPVAILFLFGIVALRMLATREGAAIGFDAARVTDAALAFGLGMFTATRVEMYVRGSRMLAAARRATPA